MVETQRDRSATVEVDRNEDVESIISAIPITYDKENFKITEPKSKRADYRIILESKLYTFNDVILSDFRGAGFFVSRFGRTTIDSYNYIEVKKGETFNTNED